MKELSIEEKAQRYDEALEKAMIYYKEGNEDMKMMMKTCFPVFVEESEDEKIRGEIYENIRINNPKEFADRYIAWIEAQCEHANFKNAIQVGDHVTRNRDGVLINLSQLKRVAKKDEKQGEQKPVDKAEPKFEIEEGKWYVCTKTFAPRGLTVATKGQTYKSNEDGAIEGENRYLFIDKIDGKALEYFRPWCIDDAKDGDVLASNHSIFIFSQEYIAGKTEAHCGIMNGLFIVEPEGCWTNEKYYPATKEQHDTLIKAMTDAGYKWNNDKKELKKIEQKFSECIQETIPNGGIVWEDFNEGDGNYKVSLAYLSKSQVELIENLVASWQNPTNNTTAWSKEDERMLNLIVQDYEAASKSFCGHQGKLDWLKSLKERVQPQNTWKPSDEQIEALESATENCAYSEYQDCLRELIGQLKKLREE